MTHKGRVSPFGHSRINACSQLPGTFRRVPRPSSPLSAKASTKCPSRACSAPISLTQEQNPLNGAAVRGQKTGIRDQITPMPNPRARSPHGDRRRDASRNATRPGLGKAPGRHPATRSGQAQRTGIRRQESDRFPLPVSSQPAPRRGTLMPRGVRQEPSSQCQPTQCRNQRTENRTQGSDRFPAPGHVTPATAPI